MADWDNGDANLLKWRAETAETGFEKTPAGDMVIPEQEYFDNAVVMVAMCKAGVELAFEEMVAVGMKPESAYYESLHETPLIANTIARMKLFEMNSVISDTAEYGCELSLKHLFLIRFTAAAAASAAANNASSILTTITTTTTTTTTHNHNRDHDHVQMLPIRPGVPAAAGRLHGQDRYGRDW